MSTLIAMDFVFILMKGRSINNMELLQINNVHKEYDSYGSKVQAIRGIDLSVRQGEFIVIVGKSGSGKSTLLSLIGGLEKASRGTVNFKDRNLSKLSQNKLADLRLKEIGIVFQQFHLMDGITALDNVELPMILRKDDPKTRQERALSLLNLVKIKDKATHYPNELSGGEKQRVSIARAMANRPDLIIADEPTGKLDSEIGTEIVELLYEISNIQNSNSDDWNPTIIMVSTLR